MITLPLPIGWNSQFNLPNNYPFLRFTLNDIFVLSDMPEGWRDLELNIKRDSENVAIYTSFTSELTFWGDGWTYLKYIIDGEGICGRVNCLIEIDYERKGNYKTLYEGVLVLTDFEVDYEKQTAIGPITSESYLDFIAKRFNFGVWYYNTFIEVGTQYTFGGLPVSVQDAARYIDTHDIVTGTQPPTAGLNTYAYRVITALNYHMQYMTENKVTVISDFFQNQSFQKAIYTVDFQSDFSPGDQVDISFKNCFGKLIEVSVVISAGTQSQMLDQISKAFVQSGDFSRFIGHIAGTANQRASSVYALFDGSMFSWSAVNYSPGALWRIDLEAVTPITDFTVTRVSGTSSINTTQELAYGMKNLFMAFNKELLSGQMGDKGMTFRQLFDMLDSHFNLGMQLTQIGDDAYQIRIEPKEYFYNNPQIVDVGSIINVKAQANTELLFQNLVVGTKGANANYFKGPSGKVQNWSVGGCSSDVTDKNTDGNFDISSIGYQIGTFTGDYPLRYPDDVSFILSTDATVTEGGAVGTPVLSEKFRIRIINTDSIYDPGGEGLLYAFNAGLINFWAVYNHIFSMTGSPASASTNDDLSSPYYIKNLDIAFSRKNYEFDTILTNGEAAMCMLQPTGAIGFKDSQGVQRSASLFELTWNINTKKAHFKVFG